MSNSRLRRIAIPSLLILSGLALIISVVCIYANGAVFNTENFADRVTGTLSQPAVREAVAMRMTDDTIAVVPAARPLRQIIESINSQIVASPTFKSTFRHGVVDLHQDLLVGNKKSVTLTVAGVGAGIIQLLQFTNPGIAKKIPKKLSSGLVTISKTGNAQFFVSLSRTAKASPVIAPLAMIFAAIFFAFAVVLAPSIWVNLRNAGIVVASSGLIILILFLLGRHFFDASFPANYQTAGHDVFDAIFADLATLTIVMLVVGVIIVGGTFVRKLNLKAAA